jgi:hypothetical protein
MDDLGAWGEVSRSVEGSQAAHFLSMLTIVRRT